MVENLEGRSMGLHAKETVWDTAYLERVAKTGSLILAMIAMVGKQIIFFLDFTVTHFSLSRE